jgi:peptidoglycan/LPS O-acetylase OafA/YrhL
VRLREGTPGPAQNDKLLELEGLRGTAALFVVFAHLQALFFQENFNRYLRGLDGWAGPLALPLKCLSLAPFNGRFCVWIFWTLSGFALSYHFFQLRQAGAHARARSYLPEAALRRYPRLLLPVLAATLFSFVLLRFGCMHNAELAVAAAPPGHPNAWIAGNYNFTPTLRGAVTDAFWTTFFSFHTSPRFDPPLWTMKREIVGSFFLFAFLAVFGGRSWRWPVYLVAGLLSIGLRQIWLDSFLAGIVLCDFRVHHLEGFIREVERRLGRFRRLRESAALALAVSLVLVAAIGYFDRKMVLEIDSDPVSDCAYIVLASLIMAWIEFSLFLKKLFSRSFFVFLGKISFGLYISHYPFLFSCGAAFYLLALPHLGQPVTTWMTVGLGLPAAIGLGTVFYLVADKPSVPFSKWLASSIMSLRSRMPLFPRPPSGR